VDGFGVGDFGRGDDCRHVQIAQAGRGRANADRFVGEFDVLGLGVGFGMYRDGADAEFPAGAQHAQGDFTAVGNQDLLKHGWSPR
jgi:hypothetical protein